MNNNKFSLTTVLFVGFLTIMLPKDMAAQTRPNDETFSVESYYKVRWGYADEFIALYKKNHYPLLKKAMEKGDLLRIVAEKPRQHNSEEARWDFRVVLVFKDVKAAFDLNLTEPYKKSLYPDLDKLAKDEQHRFELLIAHWDISTEGVNLEK